MQLPLFSGWAPRPGASMGQGPRRPLHEWPTVKSASVYYLFHVSTVCAMQSPTLLGKVLVTRVQTAPGSQSSPLE